MFYLMLSFWFFSAFFAHFAFGDEVERFIAASREGYTDALPHFEKMLERVGPERAQEILNTNLPRDARAHQFAHEIGSTLYETDGPRGITRCAAYLSGGCYHGFMIRLIQERGMDALPHAVAECKSGLASEQPGNCAHASGHGILTYVGYDQLPTALEICKNNFNGRDRDECWSGVFMQNNFGEFNVPPPGRWYHEEDPMYPCNESFVRAAGAHDACWLMQSQLTLQNDSYPHFERSTAKVGNYCSTLPARDRLTCLTGISRQLQQMYVTEEAIRKECNTLALPIAQRWCLYMAAQTAYFFGERDPDSWPIRLCTNEAYQSECRLSTIAGIVWAYEDTSARERACAQLPPPHDTKECTRLALAPEELYEILKNVYGSETDARPRSP